MKNTLVQTLPKGPIDIVGDIHGEYKALCALLEHLNYADNGMHPQGRSLVFIGDFCDRGPNSPAVIAKVKQLVQAGHAFAVLGNHEINLLRSDAKPGSGWFFSNRAASDKENYAPFVSANKQQRDKIRAFLTQLPLVLERDDIRIVHAAWVDRYVNAVREIPTNEMVQAFNQWQSQLLAQAQKEQLLQKKQKEAQQWPYHLEDKNHQPPMLKAHARLDILKRNHNPIKVLTSGVERVTDTPFYVSGKWRFAQRMPWWDEYNSTIPVVIGHYWRKLYPLNSNWVSAADLFQEIHPFAWHGRNKNVFCVDYSVGGRWIARKYQHSLKKHFQLAALQWPEQRLVFANGLTANTL